MPGATQRAMHGAAAAERRDGRARPVVRAAPPSPFGGDADDGGVAAVGNDGGGQRRRARSGDSITMHVDDPSQCLKSP